jgi:hypothetical protein
MKFLTIITHYAHERIRAGKPVPGVFEVGRNLPVGAAIEDILLLVEYSLDDKGMTGFPRGEMTWHGNLPSPKVSPDSRL